MSYNHAIRITLPYSDVSSILSLWADRSDKVVAFQHSADEEISKTHVHIALYGCEVKSEALKRMWVDVPGKGNEFWSWKEAKPWPKQSDEWILEVMKSDAVKDEEAKLQLYEDLKYLTYMSKGSLRPLFEKNISRAILERSRQLWVEPVKADKSGDPSERIIKKIMTRFDIKEEIGYHRDDTDVVHLGECEYNLELLLTHVRSVSFRLLWGEHRRVPHASHYKIIASTAFLRICEDAGCFEQGAILIQNLWY